MPLSDHCRYRGCGLRSSAQSAHCAWHHREELIRAGLIDRAAGAPERLASDLVARFTQLLDHLQGEDDDCLFRNLTDCMIQFAQHAPRFAAAWRRSLDRLSPDMLARFERWLTAYLVDVDYMPFPSAFVVNTRDEAEVAATRRKLRPYYRALHRLVRAVLSTVSGGNAVRS